MPRQELIAFVLAAAFTYVAACSEPAAPVTARAAAPSSKPDTASTPASPGYDAVSTNLDVPGLLAGDSLVVQGYVHRGTTDAPDTLAFETSDSSIVSIQSSGKNMVLIRALRGGTVAISARTRGAMPELSHQFSLQVFARSKTPSPIVVTEFSVLETVFANGQVVHVPKLRLRDTSAAGTARVIGFAIDVPQAGASRYCAADVVVGAAGWSAFNPPGDMEYGYGWLAPQGPARNGSPTVRVSVVLSDGLGVSFTAAGQVEAFPDWERYYDGEDRGVRCQS